MELACEVNSNSLKEQRTERNLRLKVSRPIKDCISESSSEPASSISNPQMQRKSYPLLKNTLPVDAFERGLALIATKTTQNLNEKIESWKCSAEEFSEVEDVVNFDAVFEEEEEKKIKMLSKNRYDLKSRSAKGESKLGDTCYSFTEFQRRLLAIDPRKTYFQCNEQKHNSKLTSEEDEKPTTSNNCLLRNRDTPFKKRACKYKRAAEPIAHLPNKKSSSSDTPRDGASSPKKKVQQQKPSTANVGSKNMNDKLLYPSSSDVSSQHARHVQTQQIQGKSKPIKIMDPTPINNKWNITISSNNTARNEEESFFRWRRLSREIDKIGCSSIDADKNAYPRRHISNSPPRVKKDLIEIRYDFIDSNDLSSKVAPESNAYNVVIKTLKKEEPDRNNIITTKSTSAVQEGSKNYEEPIQKTKVLDVNKEFGVTLNKNFKQDSGTQFHQQHEFCNYLGLTGMSTANAMANAAAELMKCNLARRSLRVRHLEQLKAKIKSKSPSEVAGGKNIKLENTQEDPVNEQSDEATFRNSNASEISETKANSKCNYAFSAPGSCVEETKESEAKIKILYQISSMNDMKEEEISNKSVKSLYKPIRLLPHQWQEDSKQNYEQFASTMSDTKYIELRPKTPSERNLSIKEEPNEVHELHEKVQNYLKEARKAVPNIFIVQSLDSTLENEKSKQPKHFDNFEVENHQSSNLSTSLAIKRSTPENKSKNNDKQTKVQRRRKTWKKTSSENRKLCTRSMLNHQRELRNRKVILKLLKTYSGLKIKVRNSKDKRNSGAQAKDKQQNDCYGNTNEQSSPLKPISTEVEAKEQEITLPLEISEENVTEEHDLNKNDTKTVFFKQIDHIYTNKTDDSNLEKASTPLKIVSKKFQTEIAVTDIDANLKQKNITASKDLFDFQMIDAAVQTDVETFIDQLPVFIELEECKAEESIHLLSKINIDMDVSSSDMVTSTTSGVGDQNRFETKNSLNLVTKKLSPPEQIQAAPDATSGSQLISLNPNPNISISSSTTNHELGIHALREPSTPLRNPLQDAAGSVLHIYFESDILIVIQESLISFWKYIRVFNALLGKPSQIKTEQLHERHSREVLTAAQRTSNTKGDFHSAEVKAMSSPGLDECEWIYLGKVEKNTLNRDVQIGAPFINRMCLSESRPVYLEMFGRELINDYRECNLLSCYVNVYFFNEEDQMAVRHSIQLDSVQSLPTDVMYTAIHESRYFVLAWPQANVLGKVRSGLCKYALTPELDMLATTRDFKAMRHTLRSLECLNDGKLVGFGNTQLTVWDHRSGDVLMNYELDMPIGRNLGTIYYPSFESGQNNVIVMIQHLHSESSSELVIIACSISHVNPARRVLLRHSLSNKKITDISTGVNNGEHLVIQTGNGEEILINCNDPRQLMFVPAQISTRFHTRGRTQVVELTNQSLTVDSFSSYLLKLAARLNAQNSVAEKKSIHNN